MLFPHLSVVALLSSCENIIRLDNTLNWVMSRKNVVGAASDLWMGNSKLMRSIHFRQCVSSEACTDTPCTLYCQPIVIYLIKGAKSFVVIVGARFVRCHIRNVARLDKISTVCLVANSTVECLKPDCIVLATPKVFQWSSHMNRTVEQGVKCFEWSDL